jgi:tungstate transport system substrate-binding protein
VRPAACGSWLLLAALAGAACGRGGEAVVLATTTSVEDSGLLATLLEAYRRDRPGATVRPLAVGSGEALELGRRGDADILIVHNPKEEEKFIAGGFGEDRIPIMYNDFVIVGPPDDPAGVAAAGSAAGAFRAIARAASPFLSRGDGSGTHGRELDIWSSVGLVPAGAWYLEAGQGMGPLLQMASERRAYTLTDRSTFNVMEPRLDLAILYDGDPALINIYSVILVAASRRRAEARELWRWLTSERGERVIAGYRDARGRSLFRTDLVADWTIVEAGADREVTDGNDPRPEGWSTLRRRFLCRSVPPSQADPTCG